MPITSTGYDSTVTEAVWATAGTHLGSQPGVAGATDYAVTLAGGLSVQVAAGVAHGNGVVDTNTAPVTLTLTRPTAGVRYDAIVLRRDWQANSTAPAIVQGATSRVVPQLVNIPGSLTEQPLALVMVPALNADPEVGNDPVISDDLRLTHAPTGVVRTLAAMTGPIGSRYVFEQDGQRYFVGPNGPEREWEPPAPAIPTIPVVAMNTLAVTFDGKDSAGVMTGAKKVAHGFGFKPTVIIPKVRGTTASGVVQVTVSLASGAIDATNVTLVAKVRTQTGWAPYLGSLTAVDLYAHAGTAAAPVMPGEVIVETPVDDSTTEPIDVPEAGGPAAGPDTDAAPAPQIPVPQTPPIYTVAAPTTSSVAGILATAAREIGTTESPAGSNKVKYWVDEKPSWNGSYWCAAFTSWVYRRNGIAVERVLDITNPYYCPTLEAGAKAKGWLYKGIPRPGDMVLYGYSSQGNARAAHVEIVEKYITSTGMIQVIGGNTSQSGSGSSNNGGGVYRNIRNPKSTSMIVRGYIRMPTTVPSNLKVRGPFPLPAGHYFGVADASTTLDHNGVADNAQGVMQIQAEVGVAVDGVYGAATEAAVKKWQAAMSRFQTGRITVDDWNVLLGTFTPPARPTGIVATAGAGSATVVFNASNGASQYTAVIYGTNTIKTATASPITFTGLTPGVPVQIVVYAANVAGASDNSARSNVVYPTEGTLKTVFASDGSVFMTAAGSSSTPQLVTTTSIANRDTTTYNAVTAKLAASQFTPAIQQAARNVAAILYNGGTYPWPAPRPNVTLEFTSGTGIAATTTSTSTITFERAAATTPGIASWLTHEVCHLIQRDSPLYGTSPQARGVIEGIADYVLIRLGYHTTRPPIYADTNWYDGYDTTAFFLHWIEHQAPSKSPDFVRRLNAQMSSSAWSPSAITGINSRGRTVDQLWAEYKTWLQS